MAKHLSWQIFVKTNTCLSQKHTFVTCFVVTNTCLSWQTLVCYERTFVATKSIRVAAPANDTRLQLLVAVNLVVPIKILWLSLALITQHTLLERKSTALIIMIALHSAPCHLGKGFRSKTKHFGAVCMTIIFMTAWHNHNYIHTIIANSYMYSNHSCQMEKERVAHMFLKIICLLLDWNLRNSFQTVAIWSNLAPFFFLFP